MSDLVPLQMSSSVVVLDHELEGWTLHEATGDEPRALEQIVEFEQPFAAPPVVQLGLIGFDVSNEDAARLRLRAVDTHPGGFTLRVETWLSSRVWSVEVSWLAVGS